MAKNVVAEFKRARAEYYRLVTAEDEVPSGQGLLWSYTDPDGKTFYLEEKRTTVKSPFTGKSFPARPKRHTPAQVGRELKEKTASTDDDFRW